MADAATGAAATGPAQAALSDVMLAMDVVDTLRHADAEVARELSGEDRAAQLKTRLREIYTAQGIEVPDRILDEGVKGIAEARFAYEPTPPSWRRTLALLWVRRRRWLAPLAAALGAAVVLALAWHFAVRLPEARRARAEAAELTQAIPQGVATTLQRIEAIASEPAVRETAMRLATEANAAARAGDLAGARERQAQLGAMVGELNLSYRIRIVQRPGEPSGIWRVPAANPRGQNFYLIVEAVDAQGRVIPVSVTSEETRETAEVTKWGLRVPQAVFEAVRRDKQDDGIIGNDIVGEKRSGELGRHWRIDTTGAAILKW